MAFKGQMKVIEFLMGCIFWIVHVMTKVYMKHILYSKSYMVFQLTFDFWPLMTLKCQSKYNWVYNGLHLLNGACYEQSLHEIHIVSHTYGPSVNLMIFDLGWPLTLGDLWSSNQGIECLVVCISWIPWLFPDFLQFLPDHISLLPTIRDNQNDVCVL